MGQNREKLRIVIISAIRGTDSSFSRSFFIYLFMYFYVEAGNANCDKLVYYFVNL